MTNTLTGLMFDVGFSAWVYYKMMRQTGSNTKSSVLVAALAGLAGFVVVYTLLGMFSE